MQKLPPRTFQLACELDHLAAGATGRVGVDRAGGREGEHEGERNERGPHLVLLPRSAAALMQCRRTAVNTERMANSMSSFMQALIRNANAREAGNSNI